MVQVSCRCGAAFNAEPHLEGTQVACPRCRSPLSIPKSPPIQVACACGKRFAAESRLAGQQLRCPGCQRPLTVPLANQPVVPQPVAQLPLQQQPLPQQPVMQQPVMQQPVMQQPVMQQPMTPQQPVAPQPLQPPLQPAPKPVKKRVIKKRKGPRVPHLTMITNIFGIVIILVIVVWGALGLYDAANAKENDPPIIFFSFVSVIGGSAALMHVVGYVLCGGWRFQTESPGVALIAKIIFPIGFVLFLLNFDDDSIRHRIAWHSAIACIGVLCYVWVASSLFQVL